MAGAVDLFLIYQFLKRLTTPFNETEAFKLGIIDERGAILKKRSTLKTMAEREAYSLFDGMIWKLKKLLEKVPGGKSKFASYAAALFLLKEQTNYMFSDNQLETDFLEFMESFDYGESDFISLCEGIDNLDEDLSIYKKTSTKSKTKQGSIFAFGRDKKLDGRPVEEGGYVLWKQSENYDGQVRGGIRKSWRLVKRDMSFNDAVDLMNKRVKHKAFNPSSTTKIKEDAPTNAAGGGNIHGIGVGPKGEPGRFMGKKVFQVSPNIFHRNRLIKKKSTHFRRIVGEDDDGEAIRTFARSKSGEDIIIQDRSSQAMRFLKKGRNR